MRAVSGLLLLALLAASCAPGANPATSTPSTDSVPPGTPAPEAQPGPQLVRADLARATSTDVTDAELSNLVAGNTEFALELYRAVADDLNVFLSPHSAAEALSMTYAGARSRTAIEMVETLRVRLQDERLHPARNELHLRLEDPGSAPAEDEREPFTLRSVNSLWGQQGYDFVADFLELLALNYDAGVNTVDFAADPEAARLAINESVERDTEGRIDDLIPQGLIDALTRLVLVNAVYFKANWLLPFDAENTSEGPFTTRDGPTVTVPMMRQSSQLPYTEGSDYQAVRLPYAGPASMVIVMPDDIETFELSTARLAEAIDGLSVHQLDLTMPRFSFRSSYSMRDILEGMGMRTAFQAPPGPGTADLTGITPLPELYIQDVVHEAFVAVDEQGTEAAAATAVVIGVTSAAPPATLTLDRPYIFLIQHDDTGEIVFIGHVGEPIQGE